METIAKTLPVCKVREVAYATFSILQIFRNGEAYLVEFDNPSCIFIRDHKVQSYPYEERNIEGKQIHEYRFRVELGDYFVLMSDGVLYAGPGDFLNFGWTWDSMAKAAIRCLSEEISASRLAVSLADTCDELYGHRPGDDTTVAVMHVIPRQIVNIFTGPPENKEDDERVVKSFMKQEGKKVVSGGTSANITARVLGKEIYTSLKDYDPKVPPMALIEGIDLVTEGVLTLGLALKLLKKYVKKEIDATFFEELDKNNGASKLAKMLIEECTEIHLFVGKAMNVAHRNSNLPFDLSIRMNLVEQLEEVAEKMGKSVTIQYF